MTDTLEVIRTRRSIRSFKPDMVPRDVIGQIEYRLQGQIVASYPVYLTEGAEAATVPWCLKKIFDSYLE